MLDHITLGVSDFEKSVAFYDQALAPLGLSRLYTVPPELAGGILSTGYGDTRPFFWIAGQDPTQGKLHLAFSAANREQVDAFHAAALAAGGKDNGAPGLRPHYHPDYYGAFVIDPDGFNIEAVFHGGRTTGPV